MPALPFLKQTFFLVTFSFGVFNASLSHAGTPGRGYLCGNGSNLFLADEAQVTSLIESSILAVTPAGAKGPMSFPQRIQCGVEGENWRICTSCTKKKNGFGYESVLPFLATHEHRDWHATWHKIRREIQGDGVNSFDAPAELVAQWQRSGWIPADVTGFINDHRIGGRLAGEDFFYMHRQMIKMLQIELAHQGKPCIAPWSDLPTSALDPVWQVPRTMLKGGDSVARNQAEQNYLNEIRALTADLLEPRYLKSVSLSQFGSDVEAAIHGKLHLLYADAKHSCSDLETDNRVECDELTHDRTAHLNIHFWKLHGFIDSLVGKWLSANDFSTIATDCRQVAQNTGRCYQWQGTWLGQGMLGKLP